jgi:nitrate/TMAO reductase-like tetraheme cytochrome c subunit
MLKKKGVRIAAVIVAVLVVLVGVTYGVAEYTTRSSFCNSCHEMNPYYQSWQASSHNGAECKDCHIPSGFTNFVKTKVSAFREIYVHFTGATKAPLMVRRQVANSVCEGCHRDGGKAKPLGTVSFANSSFAHGGKHVGSCVQAGCHQRIVHQSVSPPTYVWPASMNACFTCHNGQKASKQCGYCHKNPPHNDLGQCDSCHTLTSWTASGFTHPLKLEGVHATLTCTKCHPAAPAGQGVKVPGSNATFNFGKAPSACIDCHGDHHNGLKDCSQCHTARGWTPANFSHPQVGQHIGPNGAGERAITDCGTCHDQGYTSASCSCHGGQRFQAGQPIPGGGG